MSTEIELKAWVDNPEALKTVITNLACFSSSFEKEDTYWCRSESCCIVPKSDVRVRQEWDMDTQGTSTRTTFVTYKIKEVREGIEVNDEREFTVSDAGTFEELLKRLGLEQRIRKHKRGWAWHYEEILVELTELMTIGWFVELEIIADNNRPETITAARNRLLTFLHQIGIGEDKLESRYYTELLREQHSLYTSSTPSTRMPPIPSFKGSATSRS